MNAPGFPPRHLTDTLPFSASFESLPASFYTRLMPTPLPEPYLVCASASAAGLQGCKVAVLILFSIYAQERPPCQM